MTDIQLTLGDELTINDLDRLDYLLRHPGSAQHIFRMMVQYDYGIPMWRKLVDNSRAIETDFHKALRIPLRQERQRADRNS